MNGKIILASASPRRQELLKYIVPEFEVKPADIDESLPATIPTERRRNFLPRRKQSTQPSFTPNVLLSEATPW